MGKKDSKKKEEPPKDQFDGLALDVKNIRTAVLNLNSQEEEVLSRCANSCFTFAFKAPENCLELLELGAVEHLRRLIIHPDKLVKRHSIMALGIMSSVPKVRDHLAKTKDGFIEDCTNLLADEDQIVAEFAVNMLANISQVYQLKEDIVACGALGSLVKLLTSSDPDIKKHSLVTLISLVDDFEIRTQLGELEAVHSVLNLITSEFPTIQQLALRLATTLCLEAASRDQVTESNDLNNLVLFIENNNFVDLHPEALQCLSQCFVNPEVLVNFKDNGNLRRVIEAVKSNIETQNGEVASIAFAELISKMGSKQPVDSEALRVYVDSGIIDTLSKMLAQSDDAKVSAGHAIRVLANEASFRDQSADTGLTMKLLALLGAEEMIVRRQAVLSVAQLIQNHPTNKGIVLANKGVSTTVGLLLETDHELVCGALSLLIFMAMEEQSLPEAIESGFISSLSTAINLNCSGELLQRVLQSVTLYVRDSDTRNRLLESSDILTRIIELLQSRDRKVRLEACSAVVNLCQDEQTAQKFVDLGALSVLQKVNNSPHLRSQCSEATFIQLLDYNLPAKLSLLGHLTQANHIHDGFYDGGALGENSKFKPMVELTEMEVNDNRPVLLIKYEEEAELVEIATSIAPSSIDESAKSEKSSKSKKDKKSSKKQKEKKEEKETIKIEALDKKISSLNMDVAPAGSNLSLAESGLGIPDENQIDEALVNLIQTAKSQISPKDDYATQVGVLASLVSDQFGGRISKSEVSSCGYEVEIVELKRSRQSNIIPLGHIKKGLYRERALLFKLLADLTGVPATLEQSDYGRAWNCVILNSRSHVVNLMDEPGALYIRGSKNSSDYLSL